MAFKKGKSGNPKGRPKTWKKKLEELIAKNKYELLQKNEAEIKKIIADEKTTFLQKTVAISIMSGKKSV